MFQKNLLWGLLLGVILLGCIVVVGLGIWVTSRILPQPNAAASMAQPSSSPTPTPTLSDLASPTATFSPLSTPLLTPTEPPPPGKTGQAEALPPTTEQALTQAILPQRDQRLLAMRLKHAGQSIPETITQARPPCQSGHADTFWVTDNGQPPSQFQVTAIVRYVTDHACWWVQEGYEVNQADLTRSADRFENHTYPTNRAFFGSEWAPGVDNDPRLHIFMGNVPGVAGYFSASNEYTRQAEPYSNEREMFFINLNALRPGSNSFDSVLAHEFQHMIHWHLDRNEDTWVNEGLSELATFLNGYGPSTFAGSYLAAPTTQLTAWADTPGAAAPNYGGSFLFMAYFLQRYGEEMTRAVVANPENGITGFNTVLAAHNRPEHFNDIFADFLVANYVQDLSAGDGRWGYRDLNPGESTLASSGSRPGQVVLTAQYDTYPQRIEATVPQYGGAYVELAGQGDITIAFTGTTQVKVVNNNAHSGDYQWYSHRGDDTNTSLTRAFDLRSVSQATLTYWTWYDIEKDWDFGYVEISTDNGATWTILQPPHSAADNPTGIAYGPGYTGSSGQDGPAWVEEKIDLSAYTGQKILLRFEYVTDDAVNRPGWTLDDISIPEIGFYDDVENGAGGWQAQGFVRIDNILPQHFLAQVVEIGHEVQVRPILLNADNQGTLTITGLGQTLDQAVLIISGLTPVTTQPATYKYTLTANTSP